MKKFIAICLILTITVTLFAGCTGKKVSLEGTPSEIIEKIYAQKNVEFSPMTITPDDPNYGTMWDWTYYTGLSNGDKVKEAAVSEPMVGSIAFSLVVVRVKDTVEAKTVAQEMRDGINTRKWVCVEAGDLQIAGYGDVVMLIMVDESSTDQGLSSQAFVDAFKTICGTEPDFII